MLKVQSAWCETFASPPLVKGKMYDKFMEDDVEEVEVMRLIEEQ